MEIKKSNNFVLTSIVKGMRAKKSSLSIKFKYSDKGVSFKGHNVDGEEMAMFALGCAWQLYEFAGKDNKIFNGAMKEVLSCFENEIGECPKESSDNNEETR